MRARLKDTEIRVQAGFLIVRAGLVNCNMSFLRSLVQVGLDPGYFLFCAFLFFVTFFVWGELHLIDSTVQQYYSSDAYHGGAQRREFLNNNPVAGAAGGRVGIFFACSRPPASGMYF